MSYIPGFITDLPVHTNRSSWWCYIYTFDDVKRNVNIIELGRGSDPGDIFSFNQEKTISGVGTLRFVIKPSRFFRYLRHITPGSVVEFWMDNGDGLPPSCFAAIVDRAADTRSAVQGGGMRRDITVSCRDFTTVFSEMSCFYYASLKNIEVVLQQVSAIRALISAGKARAQNSSTPEFQRIRALTPPEFSMAFINAYFPGRFDAKPSNTGFGIDRLIPSPASADIPSGLPAATRQILGGAKLLHALNVIDTVNFISHPEEFPFAKVVFADRSLGTYPDLWAMCGANAHRPFNEFFIDTRPLSEAKKTVTKQPNRGVFGELASTVTPEITARSINDDDDFKSRYNLQQPTPYFSVKYQPPGGDVWAPRLILRPRPYLSDDLLKLPYHQATVSQLSNYDVGTSSHDTRSYFRVDPTILGQRYDFGTLGNLDRAVINIDSWFRFGKREHVINSDFVWSSESSYQSSPTQKRSVILDSTRRQTELIAQWFYRNHILLNGTITFPYLRGDIRVGNGLRLRDETDEEDYLFYIEGAARAGQADSNTSTTVSLTRGLTYMEHVSGEDNVAEALETSDVAKPRRLRYIKLGKRLQSLTE